MVSFADVVFSSVTFNADDPAERLLLDLIDTRWFQRLRDISQTANTRLVYMFSEHSRFGHSVGVAHLTNILLSKLMQRYPEKIAPYRLPVLAAALLHDIGHLAPGSHTAYRTWFPDEADVHEEISCKVIEQDEEIVNLFKHLGEADLSTQISAVLSESPDLPPWTWQVISGGGWNTDRGNWCIVDSILAGVKYGQYNVAALTDSITLTDSDELALEENRLDAMMHFAISRHAMYRQLYQHRVLMACDRLNASIAKRAREIASSKELYTDEVMSQVLSVHTPLDLPLSVLYEMNESWWRYHINRWRSADDPILSDLCKRLIERKLLKTIRLQPEDNPETLLELAQKASAEVGYDPDYYVHRFSLAHMHSSEKQQSMKVLTDSGKVITMTEADPLYLALLNETQSPHRSWIALPAEAKERMGRKR